MNKFLDWAWVGILTTITDYFIPFIVPVRWYIIFMICAVSADTITGIMAAVRQRQLITSKGIWRTLEKIALAFVVILASYGFELIFVPDLPMTKGVAMIIAAAELKSIFENYYRITGVDLGTTIISMVKDRVLPVKKPNHVPDDEIFRP